MAAISCPQCRHSFEHHGGPPASCPRCGHRFSGEGVPSLALDAPHGAVAAEPIVTEAVVAEAAVAEPPPVPRWYVMRDGQRTGPHDWAQMQRMIAAGEVQPRHMVWKEGTPQWVEAGTVTDLFPRRGGADSVMTAEVLDVRPAGEPPPRPDAYRPDGYRAGAAPWGHEREPGAEFYHDFAVHVRRAFAWNLAAMPVTDKERATLSAKGIDHEGTQKYLAWRRSIFLMVAIATTLSALLHIIAALVGKDFHNRSGFGMFTELVRIFSQLVMPVAATLACVFWSNVRLSRLLMVLGWGISFAVPILIALIPFRHLWRFELPADQGASEAIALGLGLVGGLFYFATLMPSVLSIVPGVIRACVRVKALLPQSIITGWFLIAGVPFYGLLLFVTFVTINQIAGNALLVIGVLLFMGAPVAYLVFARHFVRPADPRDTYMLGVAQVVYVSVVSLATVLLVIYLFTTKLLSAGPDPGTGRERFIRIVGFDSDHSIILPWRLLQLYIEFIGRSLFTSTLVADIFLLINHSVWKNQREFAHTQAATEYDEMMEHIGTALRRN